MFGRSGLAAWLLVVATQASVAQVVTLRAIGVLEPDDPQSPPVWNIGLRGPSFDPLFVDLPGLADALAARQHDVLVQRLGDLPTGLYEITYDRAATALYTNEVPGFLSEATYPALAVNAGTTIEPLLVSVPSAGLPALSTFVRPGLSRRILSDSGPPEATVGVTFLDPTPVQQTLNLTSLIRDSGYFPQVSYDGDLPLIVRVSTPSSYRFVGTSLFLRGPSTDSAAELLPPATIDLSQFTLASFSLAAQGELGLTVDAADYATPEDHALARSWFAANVAGASSYVGVSWNVQSLSISPAVPEPATMALWSVGLLLLLRMTGARRRDVQAGASSTA